MVISIALLVILGLIFNYLFTKMKLPGLLGMLLVGILCGPCVLNVIDPHLMEVSTDLRKVALLVILLRAGLELSKDTLHKIGKTALLMSFIPAVFEAAVITLVGPLLFNITYLEAGILGCIIAAVSPAVVVPLMISYIDKKLGTTKAIPTMIIAASSVDDIFVIVIFTILLGFSNGENNNIALKLLEIPETIIVGIFFGLIIGLIMVFFFKMFNPRATKMGIILIAVAVLFTWFEEFLKDHTYIYFSALLGSMAIGYIILDKAEEKAHKISQKLSKIWVFAEIILFVLVGAQVNINVAWKAGLLGIILIILGLLARSIGTYISVLSTDYTFKERMFCVISYIPKATVQAAIGAIPLEMGLPGGEIILALAVISIIFTAPLGAIGITLTAERFLETSEKAS